ncbi:MAG TPA: hypothetical protein VM715_03325 [Candidatus Acidoferrum sp.]|nr:hypothetical protein [Candidatus Acidoferrum sp.]
MTHLDHPVHVHLSRLHCGAICKEMGERLSLALGAQSNKLPPALLALVGRLKKQNSIFAKRDA